MSDKIQGAKTRLKVWLEWRKADALGRKNDVTESVELMLAEIERLEQDSAMLTWLIKQGPPGAAEGIGLNEHAWEMATCHVQDKTSTDQKIMREAIADGMKEKP